MLNRLVIIIRQRINWQSLESDCQSPDKSPALIRRLNSSDRR